MSALIARDVWAAPPGAPDPAVRGFSLRVDAGEWVALHGPNGGGKTTLAMVLAGLWPARRGTVEFAGRPLAPGGPPGAREAVATLLQDPSVQLLEDSVAAELALAARNLGRPEPEVARAVTRVARALGLDGDLGRDPRTLSAGRQQLVLAGAALAAEPALLVADEPGAHLDAEARARLLEAVRGRAARGLAVVWVTQDPAERAAAARVVEVGGGSAVPRRCGGQEAGGGPGAPAGPPALVLEVAPADGRAGPRVDVAGPLRIEVAAHGVTALEGPNGAGKSVLLAVATGALETGQVAVRRPLAPQAPPLLATQYPEREIFQEHVLDEMCWAAVQRGMPPAAARAAARGVLEALGLPSGFGERRTWSLSGGEKRLVQVGGALIAPAGLLALDEPTAGLDPDRREALAGLVLQRCREIPVMVASQDAGWLDRFGARRIRIRG
jgi:energy-coupling factor transporter ATP-binding protein EcfA2